MITFKEFLSESFNNPYEWHWISQFHNHWKAKFTTKDTTIGVEFLQEPNINDVWSFIFSDTKAVLPFENTKHFDALRVLSTVMNILKDFIDYAKPEIVQFSGTKHSGKAKLYDIMIKKFKQDFAKYGYEIDRRKEDIANVYFHISRI